MLQLRLLLASKSKRQLHRKGEGLQEYVELTTHAELVGKNDGFFNVDLSH